MNNQQDQPCTCNKGNVVFCPANCENRIPDREELIDLLDSVKLIVSVSGSNAHKAILKALNDSIAYIQATPLHLITATGQRLCDCEKAENVPLYKMPDVNQARMDDYVDGLTVPIANKKQLIKMACLVEEASADRKRELLKHSPWLGKLNISSLISKLERS